MFFQWLPVLSCRSFLCVNEQGGALRCYDAETEEEEEERERQEEGEGKARGYTDVAPLGGRLILFSSRHILHEVRNLFLIIKFLFDNEYFD